MPIYHYKCDHCDSEYEVQQSIKDDAMQSCILCAQEGVARVIYAPIILDRTPRTFGSLAEHNSANLGTYERDARKEKAQQGKKPIKRPPWRQDRDSADLGISKFTGPELDRYINDGVRPIGK